MNLVFSSGFGNSFRRSVLEKTLPASNIFFVQTREQSVKVAQKLSFDLCSGTEYNFFASNKKSTLKGFPLK